MQLPGELTGTLYERNVGILKQYTSDCFRLVHMRTCRRKGYEERFKSDSAEEKQERTPGEQKLTESISRSRKMVHELALCNPWEFFGTLTLSPDKVNRVDLNIAYKRIAKFINNYNSRKGAEIKFLIVPEQHKDGAWHFHGLFKGLPLTHLVQFSLNDNIPDKLKGYIQQGRSIYNWPAYAAAFGWVTMEPIIDHDRCASYMTKYITKDLQKSSIELHHHVYYCSKGLRRAEIVMREPMIKNIENPDFENDYVRTKNLGSFLEELPYFCEMEDIYGKEAFDCGGSRCDSEDQQEQGISFDSRGQTSPCFN